MLMQYLKLYNEHCLYDEEKLSELVESEEDAIVVALHLELCDILVVLKGHSLIG